MSFLTSEPDVEDGTGLCWDRLLFSQDNSRHLGGNYSLSESNLTYREDSLIIEESSDSPWFYRACLGMICLLGIVGNLLILAVLSRRRLLSALDSLERSATHGLLALAGSDLLFCCAVFPYALLPPQDGVGDRGPLPVPVSQSATMVYSLYGTATINLLLMCSTWNIVVITTSRYLVVAQPLHARKILGSRRTAVMLLLAFLFSVICSAPSFLHIKLVQCWTVDGVLMTSLEPRWPDGLSKAVHIYSGWVWPVLAQFIPVVILMACNARLIRELRRASRQREVVCRGQTVKDHSHKVTLTLVTLVLMFLILGSPAEILKYINPYESWGVAGHVVARVANLLQALNFASNFLMYCIVNCHFRQIVRETLCHCPSAKNSHRRSTSEREPETETFV